MTPDEGSQSTPVTSTPPVPGWVGAARNAPIYAAILRTIPQHRNCQVPYDPMLHDRPEFNLARELKAIPTLADAHPCSLRHIVDQWYDLTPEYARRGTFSESFTDFCRAWENVKYPAGQGPLDAALARARAADPPPEAKLLYPRVKEDRVRLLLSLCRELQRDAEDGPFFLSGRTAGLLLEVDHTTASRWLQAFVLDQLLDVVKRGTVNRATRYRYLGTIESDASKPGTSDPLTAV